MSINVVHLFTSDGGGAGIAALRLHHGLLIGGVKSAIICAEGRNNYDGEYIAPYPTSRSTRILRKLGLDEDPIKSYWKKIEAARGTYESFSLPLSYYKVEKHPCVEAADIVHLHWVSNFINYPDFSSVAGLQLT